MVMLKKLALGAILTVGVVTSTYAEDAKRPLGVIELFTSQGCSSCPPADAALHRLVEQGDVIALAYHVDYWNYIGWADTLSSKENTNRQYDYAKAMMQSNVYTPQAILNGRKDVDGTDVDAVNAAVNLSIKNGATLTVPVDASIANDMLTIKIGAGKGAADIVVVYFHRLTKVDIKRGELAGKTMTYANSVGDIETVGMWDGDEKLIQLPLSVMEKGKFNGCAILLQNKVAQNEPGNIFGAAQVLYDDAG